VKRSRGLCILAAVLLPFIATGVYVAFAFARAKGKIERHTRYVADAAAALPIRETQRPVAIGEPVYGDAWNHYDQAFKIAAWMHGNSDWIQVWKLQHDPAYDDTPADDEAQPRILAWAREVLGPLREGVRRTHVSPGFKLHSSDYSSRIENAGPALTIISTLILREHEAGNDPAALDLAALILAAGQDLERNGTVQGAAERNRVEFEVLGFCRKIFESWNAAPAQLQRFAAQLDALDGTRERQRDCWLNDDLDHRNSILVAVEFSYPFQDRPMKPGWRYLYSERIMRAQALNVCESVYRRLFDAADLDAHGRWLFSREIEEELRDHPNPVVCNYLNFERGVSKKFTIPDQQDGEVRCLSQRALLRIATALAWYEAENGKPAETLEALVPKQLAKIPTCAFSGQPFQYAPRRVWSVDQNGRDDGGDKDLVWKLKRKAP
jgi:hypothetical protein